MRPTALVTTLFVLSLAALPPQRALAQVGQTSPDYDLAYKLATASYCAYAVGQVDADGGGKRTVECLNTAAKSDGARLAAFKDITEDNVEAYYNPDHPENAYLLIQTTAGVILAFRGTLTPPISPSGGRFVPAVTEAIAKANEKELLRTFIADWKNNVDPGAILARDRHPGFDSAWSGLRNRLIAKPCTQECSKFLSFVGPLHNSATLRLYITGHSKGGALAVLAALDLPRVLGGDIVPVVYTFAGAKALTAAAAAAAQSDPAFKNMWRFEHAGDLVPSLPLDNTATLPVVVTAYAHVGNRASFTKGELPQLSPAPVDPDDRERIKAAAEQLFSSDSRSINPLDLVASFQTLSEKNCEALVHNHFLVLSDVQEVVQAAAPMPITEGNLKQSFFFTGLPDSGGDILWGYSQWCPLLTAASAK